MNPERFSEGFGMEPSPFGDKPESSKAEPRKVSRREILAGLGAIAATEASYEGLNRAWQAFVEPDARLAKNMHEQDFAPVQEFDQHLLAEVAACLRQNAGKATNPETEAVVAAVYEPVKSSIEKILSIMAVRLRQNQAGSARDLGARMTAGGFLGALTSLLEEKIADRSPDSLVKNRPPLESRRKLLRSFSASWGAVFGAGTVGVDRYFAAQSFNPKDIQIAVEEECSKASLLLADRLAGGRADHKPTPADDARAVEYMKVLQLAINPNNRFNDSKVFASHLERFGAAYCLKEFLAANAKKD